MNREPYQPECKREWQTVWKRTVSTRENMIGENYFHENIKNAFAKITK